MRNQSSATPNTQNKNATGIKHGRRLTNESPIWPWLIEYAAQVIHTFKVHKEDQRTSRQRIRADPSIPEIPKFGEHVLMSKYEPKWKSGIWLGFIDHTNEHIIGTSKGTMKCRAIRRNDVSDQFNAKMIEELKGTPWKPVPGRDSLKIPTNI